MYILKNTVSDLFLVLVSVNKVCKQNCCQNEPEEVRWVGFAGVYSHSSRHGVLGFGGVPVWFCSPQFLSPLVFQYLDLYKSRMSHLCYWGHGPLVVENYGSAFPDPAGLECEAGCLQLQNFFLFYLCDWQGASLPNLWFYCCLFIYFLPSSSVMIRKETRDYGEISLSTPDSTLKEC